jgi:ribokinase
MSIYVCGALHLDVIVTADRLPHLDETLMGHNVSYRLGGKGGNQALTAAQLGADVFMAGCIGSDEYGAVMLSTLNKAGVNTQAVKTISGPSGMSVAIVNAQGEYGAVVVSAANLQLQNMPPDLPNHTQIVLLQNEVPESVNLQIAVKAKSQKCNVILNAAPYRAVASELADCIDYVIVNRIEAGAILGCDDQNLLDETELITELAKAGFKHILLTAGANGVYASKADNITHYPAPEITLLSAHGAGDAFAGGLATGLLGDMSFDQAIELGQKAAAFKISNSSEKHSEMNMESVLAL